MPNFSLSNLYIDLKSMNLNCKYLLNVKSKNSGALGENNSAFRFCIFSSGIS